jgi:hypothetical protein
MAQSEIERMNQSDCSAEQDDMDRLECEIGSTRREASETIRDLKTEARRKSEKMKAEAKAAFTSTGEKIKSAVSGAQSFGRKAAVKISKPGLYVGIGLMTAGFLTGVIAILYGRSRNEKLSSAEPAFDAANESL